MAPKHGRKLSEKSLVVMKALFQVGKMALRDFEEAGREFDRRLYYGLAKRVYNLERSGYVKRVKKNNTSFFHLTPKGRLQFLKYFHLEKIRKGKWDGRWRVIIFDIPETLKKWREFIRPKLKELGFYPLQESVYLTPFPVTEDLDIFLEEWNLRKYFRYLTVTEIDDEDEFKQIFKLK